MRDTNHVKTAPKQVVIDLIIRVWKYLKKHNIIRKSFLVTGISNAIDRTQNHLYHLDSALVSVHSRIEEYTHLTEEVDEIQLDLFQMMMKIIMHIHGITL